VIRDAGRAKLGEEDTGHVTLLVLLLASLLLALGTGLVTLTSTERVVAENQKTAVGLLYGAEAAAERAVVDLAVLSSWANVPGGTVRSTFVEGHMHPVTSWRQELDLNALTSEVQQGTDAASAWGENTPEWHLFAWGSLDTLATGAPPVASPYAVVWIADDPGELDGDPSTDSNGTLVIRAQARTSGGRCRTVQLVLRRDPPDSSVVDGSPAGEHAAAGADASLVQILPADPARNQPEGRSQGLRLLSWREVS